MLVNKINISNNATINYLIILIRGKIKKEEKLRFIYIIILNTDISNNDNIGIIIIIIIQIAKNPYNLIFSDEEISINETIDEFFKKFHYSILKTFYSFSFPKYIEGDVLYEIFILKNNRMKKNIIHTNVKCLWLFIEKINEFMMNIILLYVYNNC